MAKPIPVITSIPGLQQWKQALASSTKNVAAPKIPWNFVVVNKQGGNYLTWQIVDSADGYIVDVSTSGDFSTGITSVKLRGNQNTAYFDTVPTALGAAPGKRSYRVRATAGTENNPQSVEGKNTAVIASTAIAPNDTTTSPTEQRDKFTTDDDQSGPPVFQ